MEQMVRKGDRSLTVALGLSVGLHLCVFGVLAAAAVARTGAAAPASNPEPTITVALIQMDMLPPLPMRPIADRMLSSAPAPTPPVGAPPATDRTAANRPTLPGKTSGPGTEGADRPATASLSTANGTIQTDYQDRLLAHIERFRSYPIEARRRGVEGVTRIHFAMGRSGSILTAWIEDSSGSSLLDAAALDTMRRAQPLPPIPADLPDTLDVVMPIAFSLPKAVMAAPAAPGHAG